MEREKRTKVEGANWGGPAIGRRGPKSKGKGQTRRNRAILDTKSRAPQHQLTTVTAQQNKKWGKKKKKKGIKRGWQRKKM